MSDKRNLCNTRWWFNILLNWIQIGSLKILKILRLEQYLANWQDHFDKFTDLVIMVIIGNELFLYLVLIGYQISTKQIELGVISWTRKNATEFKLRKSRLYN